MRTPTVLILLAATANVASAAITMQVVEVDNSSVPELAGYVTQDVVVTTDSDWLISELIVQPDEDGLIYQDDLGNANPQSPNPAFFSAFPSLEFDTYVSDGVPGEVVVIIPPVDLDGPPEVIFDTDQISIAWHTDATDDIGTLVLARVTLKDTATGTWSFLTTAVPIDGPRVEASGPIVDGHMVPEPITVSLLVVASLGLIRRRRRLLTK